MMAAAPKPESVTSRTAAANPAGDKDLRPPWRSTKKVGKGLRLGDQGREGEGGTRKANQGSGGDRGVSGSFLNSGMLAPTNLLAVSQPGRRIIIWAKTGAFVYVAETIPSNGI